MRIALQSPNFFFSDPNRNFTGYETEFARAHSSVIYLPGWKWRLTRGRGYQALLERHGIDKDRYEFAFSIDELRRKADALICFNYLPHAVENVPPRGFHGLKVWHTMDFVFNAPAANRAMEKGGVTAAMGYCDHSRHSAYFRVAYPRFSGRVIPLPFGFGARFSVEAESVPRIPKVIALGSVNPVAENSLPKVANVDAYARFYSDQRWTHRWRRCIVENLSRITDLVDSQLPVWPETKNPSYDAVDMLRNYAMFLNDEGLMAFPPARTYEGMAAGALLVGNQHSCYADFGFLDGVNCILHKPQNLEDFRRRVEEVLSHPAKLQSLADAGRDFVRSRYSHPAIADELHRRLLHLWEGRESAAFTSWT